jgi:dTDP-glucose 4,6-dehydratase
MRLFVAGGAGFIGSNFIRWVLRHTDDVRITNYDALTYAGNLANLADIDADDRYAFVQGDLNDTATLLEALEGQDTVINFAAESHVDRSIDSGDAFVGTNVLGAHRLLDAARHHAVERFVHVSTDEVYGSTEHGSFDEESCLRPNSPYAATKAAADLLARSHRETYGYPIVITRSTNNFGPHQYPEKVIPLFVTNALDGDPLPVYGDGSNVRDWIYVLDNVAAQWQVLTEGEPGLTYNVGAGNEMTNLELARAVLEACGVGDGDADDRIVFVADRPGHDHRYSVDTARIAELGWEPEHGFQHALEATVEWYRENEDWWRPLKSRGATHRLGLQG